MIFTLNRKLHLIQRHLCKMPSMMGSIHGYYSVDLVKLEATSQKSVSCGIHVGLA